MPTWITPRRLGAAAVLYAVFAGGWYLGQPLPHVGCGPSGPVTASEVTITEPGDVAGGFDRGVTVMSRVFTTEFVSVEGVVPCDATPDPRLLAWLTGDWR
ncbi:hypothetical protein [Streptomyces prasinopilosus]|uniref:hypothetical protein n=1 Tax=Streptomyces prasinopilosus TaxID=67344 RepID=UPI0006EB3C91|nr:hypothetical protein [Streptomyces prasinopilosus]